MRGGCPSGVHDIERKTRSLQLEPKNEIESWKIKSWKIKSWKIKSWKIESQEISYKEGVAARPSQGAIQRVSVPQSRIVGT
jgi:hypothetical protein